MKQPLGVILAGGQATRMGGGDKGLRMLGGQSLLSRVEARLAPQVADVALNANGDAARFAATGLPVICDTVAGFAGPLAGVLAGLDWAAEQGADTIVTVTADTPFSPAILFRDCYWPPKGWIIRWSLPRHLTLNGPRAPSDIWPVACGPA